MSDEKEHPDDLGEATNLEERPKKRRRRVSLRGRANEEDLAKLRALSREIGFLPYDHYNTEEENEPCLHGARQMFMEGYRFEDISQVYDIPAPVFKQLAYTGNGCWLDERNKFQEEMIRQAVEDNVDDVMKIRGLTIAALHKYLYRINARDTELSMKEAKLASDMLANLDRIYRLDNSKPTEITKRYESMSPDQVREEIRKEVIRLQAVDEIVDYSGKSAKSPDLVNFEDIKRH